MWNLHNLLLTPLSELTPVALSYCSVDARITFSIKYPALEWCWESSVMLLGCASLADELAVRWAVNSSEPKVKADNI